MVSTDNKNAAGSLAGREIEFRVLRYSPERDRSPHFQTYRLKYERGMTVLDALMRIKETQDPTLSYRKSCRMGICGSCAMYVNGKPILTCQTQIRDLNSELIEVRPLPNFPILRDLVPDFDDFFRKHAAIRPYLIRPGEAEQEEPAVEYAQSPEELERYLQFSYCIKCGACVAACPTNATDREYAGPQALAAAYRYAADSRDGGIEERCQALDGRHGVWRCHFAGACSEACPKGVDPALGIQLLKREIIKHKLLHATRKPAPPVQVPAGTARREGVPQAPPRNADK
jgi:succinate dehydrogenase / fumarate reductase, iron-sulfur subunit